MWSTLVDAKNSSLSDEELGAMLSMLKEHMILYLYDISEMNFMEEYVFWDTDLSVLFLFL